MKLKGIVELQNGSDVRGIAMEGVEGEEVNLTPNIVTKIVYSFCTWLKAHTGKKKVKVSVGFDSRLSAKDLVMACRVGILSTGCDVVYCYMTTTPSMFMTTVDPELNCDGAIMVTASHLPFNRNGLKFFTKKGGLEPDELKRILKQAEVMDTPLVKVGEQSFVEYMPKYAAHIVEIVRKQTGEEKPLEGAHIIVDAGNGAGGFFPRHVLRVLGANTDGSQFLEPDGHFPNHIPNPENKEAMAFAVKAVLDHQADMGIIFDTDVDRAAIIDEKGHPINRNGFIAFIAHIILQQYPGSTIVTDSVTSTGLTEYIEKLGGKHHRFKRGYKNVINEAIRLNKEGTETHLAMETSGHGAVKENYFLDDGAYLVTMALVQFTKLRKEGRRLSEFLTDLKEPAESQEVRYTIHAENFKDYGQDVLEKFRIFAEAQEGWSIVKPNYEGVRVDCDADHGNGWCLLRMSLHEPKMPLNIESDNEGGCKIIKNTIDQFMADFSELKA